MQRLLPLLLLPTTALCLLSPPQRNRNHKSTTNSPPYTCDSILGNNLCDLKEEHKTFEVRGTTLHYWVYQVAESREEVGLPIILINGGPGMPHNYLLPMKVLACSGRKVIFYDQAGTGLSSVCPPPVEAGSNPNDCLFTPDTSHLLTLDYYPEELAALVTELDLESSGFHVFGHSWGTIVATLYAAKQPTGLRTVVLGGALANSKVYIDAQWDPEEGNLGTLPVAMQEAIRMYEAEGAFLSPEYQAIAQELTSQFTVRTFPAPDCTYTDNFNYRLYVIMQGPSEFSMTEDSVIADMDLSPELRNISIPVLMTNGAFDTMRPPNIRQMVKELEDVTTLMLPRSGHMTMIDQPLEMAWEMEAWLEKRE